MKENAQSRGPISGDLGPLPLSALCPTWAGASVGGLPRGCRGVNMSLRAHPDIHLELENGDPKAGQWADMG